MAKFDFKRAAMRTVGVAVGAVGAKALNNIPFFGGLAPVLRGGLKIGVGAALPELMPKQKMLEDVGAGLIAVGSVEVVSEFAPAFVKGVDEAVSDNFTVDALGRSGEEVEGLNDGIGSEEYVQGINDGIGDVE